MNRAHPKLIVVSAILTIALTQSPSQSAKAGSSHSKPTVIAVVLGKEVANAQKDRLNGMILGQLLERFAKENKIAPTDDELDEFVVMLEVSKKAQSRKWRSEREKLKAELKSDSHSEKDRKAKENFLRDIESILATEENCPYLTPKQEKETRRGRREMARMFVRQWKINQALFKKYGGRVIFQQAGPEPLDAYRRFLREHERKGDFEIRDPEAAKSFWNYFVNEKMHVFASGEQSAEIINRPWWKKTQTGEAEE